MSGVTWAEVPLFELEPVPVEEPMSADRRRTARRQAMLDRGLHPATGLELLGGPATCLDCESHVVTEWSRTYHKCRKAGMTHGAGTDIRVSWPACSAFVVAKP